jgi:2-C-methyl-D-erythritol 4-phosphate cytidylyltransferase
VSSSTDPALRAAAVVVAGGSGRRLGGEVPKQFLPVRGVPVLLRAVRPFVDHPDIDPVVVVLPPDVAGSPPAWLVETGVRIVAGGAERSDSVACGLAALPSAVDLVLVHDGARPFVERALIDRLLDAGRDGPAIPGVPVVETVKEVDADGWIVSTPPRDRLRLAQTPQVFPLALLREVHRATATDNATDDAVLVERHGVRVRVVPGDVRNLKITTPADLAVADALAARWDAG